MSETPLRQPLRRTAEVVGAGLFFFMFLTFIVQVAARYVFRSPLGWTQEFIMVMFLWTTFWCAAFVVPIRQHIVLGLLVDTLPDGLKRALNIITLVAGAAILALALPASADYIHYMFDEPTGAMRLPFGAVYYGFLIFMVAYTVRSLMRAWRLLRPGWRDHL